MNCSILVKNIPIQVVSDTFSVFLVIDACDTLFLTEKYFLIEEIKRYYRIVVETMNKEIEVNIYYYLDFQTIQLIQSLQRSKMEWTAVIIMIGIIINPHISFGAPC